MSPNAQLKTASLRVPSACVIHIHPLPLLFRCSAMAHCLLAATLPDGSKLYVADVPKPKTPQGELAHAHICAILVQHSLARTMTNKTGFGTTVVHQLAARGHMKAMEMILPLMQRKLGAEGLAALIKYAGRQREARCRRHGVARQQSYRQPLEAIPGEGTGESSGVLGEGTQAGDRHHAQRSVGSRRQAPRVRRLGVRAFVVV